MTMKRFLKGFTAALLAAGCLFCCQTPVRAETYRGSGDWQVTFADQMKSSFKTADMSDTLSRLEPGDSAIFTIKLVNQNEKATDWYMRNNVLSSLEDHANGSASGGGYSYSLSYKNSKNEQITLFDSDTLGGESPSGAGEGLHAATQALKEYFYLDTLENAHSGEITLQVSLDGETQGNDYQDTLADLEMKFAVETAVPNSGGTRTQIVRTGDELDLQPLYSAMAISGVLLLILACFSLRKGKKDEKKEK